MVGVEPLLSRRTALTTGAGAAVAGFTGCGVADGTPAAAEDDEYAADLRLLRRAVQREEQLAAELRHAARRYPRLRADLQRAVAAHEDHVEVLARSLGSRTTSTVVDDGPRTDPASLARGLARTERRLAGSHAAAARRARSGPFARVLAGMSAAAEQQALVLDALATSTSARG
jgi:hypothetical protein